MIMAAIANSTAVFIWSGLSWNGLRLQFPTMQTTSKLSEAATSGHSRSGWIWVGNPRLNVQYHIASPLGHPEQPAVIDFK